MAFRDLTLDKAIFISIELANKAFSHLLTAVDITKITITALNNNPFAYSANAKSQYILTVFIGIIINIEVLRKSTASYK
jgi:uncharacterized metal-binding protein